ncbi:MULTISPECIES: hypothetical protein [unclassified Myxococcus]|uniref:hypothetical protein n=1 Tax=unclassified Myxococcus TaxID=2648731 RepID=UPI00157AA466|nr:MULTISPECIES: hypothetical protein [unclassified Myxococcus]NTX01727.1 hypothetical protein [Myxococcus sp. CA040A]NTX40543.1 hypothetical protein [Myxococcus sp. CA033]
MWGATVIRGVLLATGLLVMGCGGSGVPSEVEEDVASREEGLHPICHSLYRVKFYTNSAYSTLSGEGACLTCEQAMTLYYGLPTSYAVYEDVRDICF